MEIPSENWKKIMGRQNYRHDYTQALLKYLGQHVFEPTDGYPFIFHAKQKYGPTLVAITVDDILVVAPYKTEWTTSTKY